MDIIQQYQGLNTEQSEFVVKFLQFMSDKTRKVFGLYGMGGTGKTYVTKFTIQELRKSGFRGKIGAIAPTNSACKTLKKALSGVNINISTVASALGLNPALTDDGRQVFIAENKKFLNDDGELEDAKCSLEDYDLLIIEEASMINREQFWLILEKLKYGCKILILMDQWQLRPVGDKIIEAVSYVGNNYHELLKTERYSQDSYIYKVILSSLNAVINKNPCYNPLDYFPESVPENDQGHGYFIYDEKEALESFARQVDYMLRTQQYDYTRLVTWRKATIDKYNNIVRQIVIPYAEYEFVRPGEMLISFGAVKREDPNSDKPVIIYNTATSLIVERSTMKMVLDADGSEWKIWECLVFDPDLDYKQNNFVNILDNAYKSKFEQREKELRALLKTSGKPFSSDRKKAERKLFDFLGMIDPIRHNYAINAYPAQGNSFTISNIAFRPDISRQRFKDNDFDGMNRSLYVALSRARCRINIF